MRPHGRVSIILIVIMGLMGGVARVTAHKDPCHQRHACPSDTGSYVCGDRGRCEQCPDNQYCLAGQPRLAAAPSPASAPPASTSSPLFTPEAVTVCFTPGGNCTEQIVKALGDAKSSILVQAYSFTSAPMAKALLEAHKRGVQVQVILDKSGRGARPCRNASEACQSW